MVERGHHAEFSDPGIEISNSVMDVDAKVVASSMDGGVRVAGQAEFAPIDAPPDGRCKDRLVKIAKAAFRDIQTDRPSFWTGRRPSFPDSLPMLGRVPDHKGLFLNFGHAHYGLMMAPKSGDSIAQLMGFILQNGSRCRTLFPFTPTSFARTSRSSVPRRR